MTRGRPTRAAAFSRRRGAARRKGRERLARRSEEEVARVRRRAEAVELDPRHPTAVVGGDDGVGAAAEAADLPDLRRAAPPAEPEGLVADSALVGVDRAKVDHAVVVAGHVPEVQDDASLARAHPAAVWTVMAIVRKACPFAPLAAAAPARPRPPIGPPLPVALLLATFPASPVR